MDHATLMAKSVRELRALLEELGLSHADCLEKSDLVTRLLSAPPKRAPAAAAGPRKSKATLGGLECVVFGEDETPTLVAVFLHGYGAGGDDLVPLAQHLASAVAGRKVTFVFPAAPLALAQGGRAWYPLDLQELIMRAMSGQIRQIVEETPPGLDAARAQLHALLSEVQSAFKVALSQILIGGFSQGATCALDAVLRLDGNPAAVVLWSPPVVSLNLWAERAAQHSAMRVQHSHGQSDPIVPFFMATLLQDRVLKPHTNALWTPFAGQHSIPPQALTALANLLVELTTKDGK